MNLTNSQKIVDEWIKTHGVRYFDIQTNSLLLVEEVGEFCRLVARIHGEQSFKTPIHNADAQQQLADELVDILFVTICLANQLGINLDTSLQANLMKKTNRDLHRHKQNPKL